ncbi:MAG: hypothetical protein KDA66_01780, partial [Planctomycetaceae bacterium]|nr:hypothetical protein [Planctomycetaceae bacterium]
KRMVREVCTKFHLVRPWYIPVKLVGEVRAWMWARNMVASGPKLLEVGDRCSANDQTPVVVEGNPTT